MFATFALTALLASASLLRVRADVTPSDPGPGVVYKVGGTCHIAWVGDTQSETSWKNMAIQLMTGDNLNMIHLTTVATGLDGTVDGTFDHICPSVSPNAPIYFYQFTSPNAPVKEWTTRFTIASSTGATTAPTNNTQPNGAAIPWGTGALTDPSTAVQPPPFAAVASGGSTSFGALTSAAASVSAALSSSTPAIAGATTAPPLPVSLASVTPASSGFGTLLSASAVRVTPSAAVSASANSTSATKDNAAVAVGADSRLWQAAMALTASTIAFAVLL
ncbi:hypothetical protein H2248_011040 [Termitomyces sp. 'cryptogamus']|nr:hypothetical protein H2248_011040 [Termitomyces sp. 'cryptogamus']